MKLLTIREKQPLNVSVGETIKPWGKIIAIGRTGGERYLWFSDRRGISMIPYLVAIEHRELNETSR